MKYKTVCKICKIPKGTIFDDFDGSIESINVLRSKLEIEGVFFSNKRYFRKFSLEERDFTVEMPSLLSDGASNDYIDVKARTEKEAKEKALKQWLEKNKSKIIEMADAWIP
jgi:uncharacterized protein YifE (UPF0438 family)